MTRQLEAGRNGFVRNLAMRQARSGHQVRAVALEATAPFAPVREMRDGVEIRRIPFLGSARYPIAPAVLRHIGDADIVHVHALDFFTDFLSLTRFLHGRRLVLSTHGERGSGLLSPLKRLYFSTVTRLMLTGYDAVVTDDAQDGRIFQHVRKQGMVEIGQSLDIRKFAGLSQRAGRTIIYFGRLAPNKGLEVALRWFLQFSAKHPGWTFVIAGRPAGVEGAALQAEIDLLDLADRVTIHESPTDAELSTLIARSKVFVSAASYEGLGIAAVEAASAGLYPVLSAIPAYERIVERLGYGTLIDFTDPKSWAEGDNRLVSDLKKFEEHATNEAIERAVSSFAWTDVADKYEQTYREVLGETRRRIGRVHVDVHDYDSATQFVARALRTRKPTMITFANAHTINVAARFPAMRQALERATVFNDGAGVDLASQILYQKRFPDNLNGTDFIPHVLRQPGLGALVYVLGSTPAVAKAAAEHIADRYPHVTVVGHHHGFFTAEEEADVARKVRASGANLVLVGMGQPRQEIWTATHLDQLPAATICVGALLDFMAGRITRAPASWRKHKLEWLYRLLKEPRRLAGRYLVGNFSFVVRVLYQRMLGYRV